MIDKDAIADIIRDQIDPENRGVMVNNFIAIAEVIDSRGQRGLVRLTNESLSIWNAIGMLKSIGAELETAYAQAEYESLHGEE